MDIPSENPHALRFGAFEFDPRSGDLRRHGLRIRLAAQPLAILKTLVDRHGEAVTRDELRRVLWTSDTFVDFEVGLNSAVRKLREALDDSAESPRFIETLPRLGYRFIAPVAAARAGVETAPLDGDPQSFPVSESVPGAGHEQLRGAIGKWSAAARASSPRIVWSAGFMLLTVAVAAGVLWQGRPSTGPPATAVEVAGVAGSSARTPQSIDERAHKAYVRGLTARAEQDGLSRAVSYFEEAVAVQPDFAEAYGLLALVQVQFLYGGPFSPHQTVPKAEAAARKALQLNERLGHAHWALGQILALYYWRWEESANALKRAADLLGEDELSLALGESLIRTRHFTEAVALAERARKLDPRSVNAQVAVALAYRAAGQHDRAVEELRGALEVGPGYNRVRFQLGTTLVAMGRLDDGISELRVAALSNGRHNSRMEAYLGYAYAAAGHPRPARELLKELESHRREEYVSWFGIALIYDALGEKEPALRALQRAYEDRAVEFGQMAAYPPFKAIASEPRFEAVMRHVGLPR